MLRIENLSKRYGDFVVFQGLDLSFFPACVALCEEESTGKSSLLAVIAGAMAPDAGDVLIDGHSVTRAPAQARARTAYVPADCMAFPTQTGRERLESVAVEKNTKLNADVIDLAHRLGLTPHLDKRFEQMSTGTRRKVFLVAAAIGDPAVVVGDGPTDGLDAQARVALAEQFRRWAQDRVVLFASHDAEFVRACDARRVNLAGDT